MISPSQIEYLRLILPNNPGVSNESETLTSIHIEFNYAVDRTSFGQRMLAPLSDLEEVFIECLNVGWDGYDARPLSIAAFTDARNFIRLLPTNISAPEIVPEPAGGIGLEWISPNSGRFIISFDGSGTYAYAGIYNSGARVRGIELMSDSFPKELNNFIARLFK